MRFTIGILGAALVCMRCDRTSTSEPAPEAAATGSQASGSGAPAPSKVEIVELEPSAEPLDVIVKREQQRALRDRRDLLIYVGAPWCEPCTRFHDAAKRGELDAVFPTLRLLELDRDKDEERLRAAGCLTKMIPLFAVPTANGGCDLDRSITGSIKGPGAVANITPRLKRLLDK